MGPPGGAAGGPGADPPAGVSVFNALARPRGGMARVTVQVPADGTRWLEVRDGAGQPVRALAEGVRRRPDGSLAEMTLTLGVLDVPALGFLSYRLVPADPSSEWTGEWRQDAFPAENTIENGRYVVTADPARGGTVSVTDKRSRTSVLAGPGNELVIQDEYAQHPRHGEGPWHLSPKGPGLGSVSVLATVRQERCPIGSRLVASFALDGLDVSTETVLWENAERVEFRTHVDSYRGRDRLLRVRFPADVPGGLPVYQTATAVVGRSFGVVDVDSADHWYTLDNPAHQWFGVGSTARVRTGGRNGLTQAIGVAEVVCPLLPNDLRDTLRELLVALAAAGVTATCSQADGSRYGGIDADSNLPDVRIAVGGPEVNPFTAEVLAAAGPGYAKALAARLDAGAGTARLWVPAMRDRADAFGPDADVRGAGDLPVLIVAGAGPAELAAAVTALAASLADAVVDAGDPADMGPGADAGPGDGDRPVPLADRSVAVLNRGTPGCVVTPDGTLHMSLMRSCSAWPSGIWIDGDRRAAPDGSSFAWQHWSHTFEYALAAGPGDWRTAGFNLIAEDYNHDLIAVTGGAGPQPGAGQRSGAGLSVDPATVTVSALKPRGNPLAAGRTRALTDAANQDATITVRLRETSGRPTTARVRLGPGEVSTAWLTDLLEESDGAPLPVENGTIFVDMPAFGTVTLLVRGDDPPDPPAPGGNHPPRPPLGGTQPPRPRFPLRSRWPLRSPLPPRPRFGATLRPPRPRLPLRSRWPFRSPLPPRPRLGPQVPLDPQVPLASQAPLGVQPVYARYWLHGKGPAPAGNLPVAVHFSPVRVALGEPGEEAALTLTVGCSAEPASGVVELVTPAEVTVVPDADLRYQLAPGGYAAWDLAVRVPPGTATGRYFVAARIRDDLGHLVEDTAMVAVGERRWPDPELPPEETLELMQTDYSAAAAEVDLAVLTPELRLAPGGQGELLVRVTSGLASELHGEAQLVSPFGTWEMLGPPAQGFSIAPGMSTVLRFAASVPTTARNAQWWALVKVMYYGRVRYTEAIPVVIEPVN